MGTRNRSTTEHETFEAPLTNGARAVTGTNVETEIETPRKRRRGLMVNGDADPGDVDSTSTPPSKSTRSNHRRSAKAAVAEEDQANGEDDETVEMEMEVETPTRTRRGRGNGYDAANGFDDSSFAAGTPLGTPVKSPGRGRGRGSGRGRGRGRGRGGGRGGARRTPVSRPEEDVPDTPEETTPRASRRGRGRGKLPFSTPTKQNETASAAEITPTTKRRADRSARKKSGKTIEELERTGDDEWDDDGILARQIRGEDDDAEDLEEPDGGETGDAIDEATEPSSSQPATPSKKRGRRRLPTPEGDIAPQERYFFQNRAGSVKASNNTIPPTSLLSHEEYFELMGEQEDDHVEERAFLLGLHARSFPQWRFEFCEGFNVCIYGFGSKRGLVNSFAEWLHREMEERTEDGVTTVGKIVIVNGYAPTVSVRSILSTTFAALLGDKNVPPSKMPANPTDLLNLLLSELKAADPPSEPITLLVNSIDAASLRGRQSQQLLAKLASSPRVNLLATADAPNFPLLWDTTLRGQFNFVFHDCTTFAPYTAEVSVVDAVNVLLGRSGRRAGGREGIGFVLRSLPENARSLYRVLVGEVLAAMAEGGGGGLDDHHAATTAADMGVEYRYLYSKAAEEFICSSEVGFRAMLKEFADHEMVTVRRDVGGAEMLTVPLARDDMEGVLEDLL